MPSTTSTTIEELENICKNYKAPVLSYESSEEEEEQLKNNALNKESIRKKRALKKTILNKRKAQRSGKKISKKRKISKKSWKEATEHEETNQTTVDDSSESESESEIEIEKEKEKETRKKYKRSYSSQINQISSGEIQLEERISKPPARFEDQYS